MSKGHMDELRIRLLFCNAILLDRKNKLCYNFMRGDSHFTSTHFSLFYALPRGRMEFL